MPANSRWDLIRRVRVKAVQMFVAHVGANVRRQHGTKETRPVPGPSVGSCTTVVSCSLCSSLSKAAAEERIKAIRH